MLGRILSYLLVTIIAVTFPFFYIGALTIWLLTVWWDKRLVILQQYTCFWGSFYTWIMPLWRIKIDGRKNIRRGAKYVVVSNHQSQLDILINFRLFFHYKIVSKTEMFKVPFMGWNMTLNRYIMLKRGDKESIAEMMDNCERTLAEGSSVLLYPEGTRSKDGKIQPFKTGAFSLAKKMKVPILPVIINGTGAALPKYTMETSKISHIHERVLEEIPYESFAHLPAAKVAEMVHDIMKKELEKLEYEYRKNTVGTDNVKVKDRSAKPL